MGTAEHANHHVMTPARSRTITLGKEVTRMGGRTQFVRPPHYTATRQPIPPATGRCCVPRGPEKGEDHDLTTRSPLAPYCSA